MLSGKQDWSADRSAANGDRASVNTIDGRISRDVEGRVNEIVARLLPGVARLWERFLVGGIPVC